MSARFDVRAYREPRPVPWLIRLLGPVNRALMLRGVLRLRAFDLPEPDLARLRAAVHPGTAAFLGPNHPEFTTDWLVDKEISCRCSPLMAHWASYEIVNGSPLSQRFWLANNLIANAPGGGGKEYSVRWARAGHGVLLHPEGTATWQAERTSPLLPGIVDMAWEAAEQVRAAGESRPVFVVPLVWKLVFTADASDGLRREMARIERALGLPAGGTHVGERFAALMRGALAARCRALELPVAAAEAPYFAAQSAAMAAIRERLTERHGEFDADMTRAQHRLRGAIRRRLKSDGDEPAARRDRALVTELQRLHSFDRALYDRPTLTQEQVAENLKRVRSALLTHGWRDALHNLVPVAVAPRTVHVRVPEPLDVGASLASALALGRDPAEARAGLLADLHERLQRGLDRLGAELAPLQAARRVPFPLHDPAS
ncbi:MAG: hypothetical protein HZA61_14630 [Candidatus Eisenbacteria bacterium]|uniref:Uncharacterized protein n=1 Tax=Eiseniibacteriota bacterium TaxID=2212470 RepID=A0A933SEM5_UNCEI|nr:hypothetical protein [Candidatus Eisenbacteria bacterium]